MELTPIKQSVLSHPKITPHFTVLHTTLLSHNQHGAYSLGLGTYPHCCPLHKVARRRNTTTARATPTKGKHFPPSSWNPLWQNFMLSWDLCALNCVQSCAKITTLSDQILISKTIHPHPGFGDSSNWQPWFLQEEVGLHSIQQKKVWRILFLQPAATQSILCGRWGSP